MIIRDLRKKLYKVQKFVFFQFHIEERERAINKKYIHSIEIRVKQ